MRRIILKSFQSPGDISMLTAAVRDLHRAHPGKFQTDVRTSADALWIENPLITPLKEGTPGVETLDMHYPLIHQSNHRPYHFIHGYAQYLEQKLGVSIPVSDFRGDIYLSDSEKAAPCPGRELGVPEHFWILMAGGKYDFTAKWWNPDSYQQVVDYFSSSVRGSGENGLMGASIIQPRITFVQCGEAGHWHTPLKGVVNLIGQTDLREFVRLMYHADGVLCPVTLAMHLAAAVETKPGRPKHRPCVVVAGGREPAHWEAYTHHQFISTNGALPCCADGGCWKSRCQLVKDGDAKDRDNVCTLPVEVSPDLRIPKCMDMITAEDVIRRIELYYDGGMLQYGQNGSVSVSVTGGIPGEQKEQTIMAEHQAARAPRPCCPPLKAEAPMNVAENAAMRTGRSAQPARRAGGISRLILAHADANLRDNDAGKGTTDGGVHPTSERTSLETHATTSVSFYHGLGDCAYFAPLIDMYTKRGYPIEVECTPDKRILFEAAGATTIASGAKSVHPWGYPSGSTHAGQGRFWQGSKMGHNISESPLPDIGSKAELWDEYCATKVDVTPLISSKAHDTVSKWLKDLPRPIILLHTKGNTGQERKSLPDPIALDLYRSLLDRFDGTIILLDWDKRVPRLPSYRVRHLDEFGGCSTEQLFALMTKSSLLIGVDSGPLHAAQLTNIPSVGIWMPGHYPATYTLPRKQQLNIVLQDHTRQWNKFKRIPWNIVEHPGGKYDSEIIADYCAQMLGPSQYLPASQIAADVQFRSFLKLCRGVHPITALSAFADRHLSFQTLFRAVKERFPAPTMIETGTIRAEEDWPGAGFFTYLAGAYLARSGGHLHSVDIDPQKCAFARDWTGVFGSSVSVHAQDSVSFLRDFPDKIDVLYLDSLDTTEPGHAQHCVAEFEAAKPHLHSRSLVVVDDTPLHGGQFAGKGARLVPQLLNDGWRILYGGYQVVLTR